MAIEDNADTRTGDADLNTGNDVSSSDVMNGPDTGDLSPSDQEDGAINGADTSAQHNIIADMASAFFSLFRSKPRVSGPVPLHAVPRHRNKTLEKEENEQLLAQMRAKEKIEERLERYRKQIRDFDEDRENILEKGGRWFFLVLAYVGPVILAWAVGKELGDAYGGPFSWTDGWSLGMHVAAFFGEMALPMISLSAATALRRFTTDRGYIAKLISTLFFLLVFSLASGLAQWFVAATHLIQQDTSGTAALVFRVVMPTAVDVASLLYISIMKFKSLKTHINNLKMEADALRELNDAEIGIRKAQNNAKQQEQREQLLMDVEAIQAKAVLKAVEQSLNGQDKRNGFQMRA